MNKAEFLGQLRRSLNGKLDEEAVADNIKYYDEYISSQLRLGRTESEVMATLGSPRLIARTITDTMAESVEEAEFETTNQTYDQFYEGQGSLSWLARLLSLPKWLKTCIACAVTILIFVVVFTILKFLFPLILLVMIAMFVSKLFRDWLN